jgi:hypothetical protein
VSVPIREDKEDRATERCSGAALSPARLRSSLLQRFSGILDSSGGIPVLLLSPLGLAPYKLCSRFCPVIPPILSDEAPFLVVGSAYIRAGVINRKIVETALVVGPSPRANGDFASAGYTRGRECLKDDGLRLCHKAEGFELGGRHDPF